MDVALGSHQRLIHLYLIRKIVILSSVSLVETKLMKVNEF